MRTLSSSGAACLRTPSSLGANLAYLDVFGRGVLAYTIAKGAASSSFAVVGERGVLKYAIVFGRGVVLAYAVVLGHGVVLAYAIVLWRSILLYAVVLGCGILAYAVVLGPGILA